VNESEVDQLRRFVRHTLGCGCPEEVLRRIDRAPDLELPVEQGNGVRLDVGGRLLVYLLPAATEESTLRVQLAAAVEAGLADRQRGRFNRLRIVLVSDGVEDIERAARRAFADCHCPDARVHLHVVDTTEVPGAARPPQ